MRCSATRLNAIPATTPLAWLISPSLKVAQLQRIAQATGIQSTGPKSALVQRLQTELPRCALQAPQNAGAGRRSNAVASPSTGMSILSIDMGIQNLAFAHLLVREGDPRAEKSGSGMAGGHRPRLVTTLNAWHRLAVSKIPVDLGDGLSSQVSLFSQSTLLSGEKSTTSLSRDKKGTATESVSHTDDEDTTISTSPSPPTSPAEKNSFPIHLYAARAYTLITTLLDTYKPTHVLIERQRFRSGGASAVQEWTLRVGVFEGMLYALLHGLKQECKRSSAAAVPVTGEKPVAPWSRSQVEVYGIEPQRVARYWLDEISAEDGDNDDDATATGKGTRRKLTTSREGKKAKIDIVGRLLLSSASSVSADKDDSMTATGRKMTKAGISLNVDDDDRDIFADNVCSPSVQTMVDAYLYKWQGRKAKQTKTNTKTKTKNTSTSTIPETVPIYNTQVAASSLAKLDDLADSLLQGLTWLDWQIMRDRILREGVRVLEGEDKDASSSSSSFESTPTAAEGRKKASRRRV